VRDDIGPYFQQKLREFDGHPAVGEVRGVGLIGALELLPSAGKAGLNPATPLGARAARIAREEGVIVRGIRDLIADMPDSAGGSAVRFSQKTGKQVEGLPSGVDVIAPAFAADVGVDAEPLQIPGGGYVWFDVTGVTPARERSLDDVRAQVEERWRNDEVSKRLRAKATEMADKLKAGTPFADVAAAESLPVQTTFGLKRAGNRNVPISTQVVGAVFQTAKDAAAIAEGNSPGEWTVFRVTDITVADFDAASPEVKRIADQMRRSLTEDVLAQYVQRLQTDIGATIYQDALRRVASGSTDQN